MKSLVIVASLFFVVVILILFFNRSHPLEPDMPPDEFMAEMAAAAVLAAQDEFSVTLDYSIESVEQVEEILGQLHEQYTTSEDQRGMRGYAIMFAAYIGESLKRHLGRGHWERDHPVGGEKSWPFTWDDSGHASFPYGWCGRRIENGPEDNVWTKLRVIMEQETNSLNQLLEESEPTP